MQLALECEERVCVGRGPQTALTLGIHVPPGATRGRSGDAGASASVQDSTTMGEDRSAARSCGRSRGWGPAAPIP